MVSRYFLMFGFDNNSYKIKINIKIFPLKIFLSIFMRRPDTQCVLAPLRLRHTGAESVSSKKNMPWTNVVKSPAYMEVR